MPLHRKTPKTEATLVTKTGETLQFTTGLPGEEFAPIHGKPKGARKQAREALLAGQSLSLEELEKQVYKDPILGTGNFK